MTYPQAIFLSVLWFGWAISCKWTGSFSIANAVILAIMTYEILTLKR